MMTVTYSFSISSDFKNIDDAYSDELYSNNLHYIIKQDNSINTHLKNVYIIGDVVYIKFKAVLSFSEKSSLDSIVSNYKLTPSSDTDIYDAIVDVNGNGDYSLISEAFDAGHISIFVRNGIYYEPADIIMPDFGSITGESGGGVVIDFSDKEHGIIADGSKGKKETAGTISVSKKSDVVVGVGTHFTKLNRWDSILIGTDYYRIHSIIDDLNLKLYDAYQGISMTGLKYIAQHMHTGIMLTKIIITNSAISGLYLRACWHFTLISVSFNKNSPNLSIIDSGSSSIKHVLIRCGKGDAGACVCDSISISFDTMDVCNNLGDGITIKGASESLMFKSCEVSNNGGCGFYIKECVDLSVVDTIVKKNVNDGVYLGPVTHNVNMSGLICMGNGGNGFNILGYEHIVSSSFCNNNKKTGIRVECEESIIRGNICKRNGTSVDIINSNNIISYNIPLICLY